MSWMGGAVRQFKMLDKKIMDLPIVDSILRKNINMIKNYQPLMGHENLTIGIHFIRYVVNEWSASYSSPDWLHKDDEPLVFIHLVGLSRFALGGDNLIASDDGKITNVIHDIS